ncbi:unnamed protein product [Somion occarium]|uniref:Uncharacterized protein n=1 Tax=Somion occarium TaxID=3059160 RepID=A0ABP1D4N9_9APHY
MPCLLTAASSPPPVSQETTIDEHDDEDISEEDKRKWDQLAPFLEKVTVYARLLKDKMDEVKKVQSRPKGTATQRSTIKPKSAVGSIPKFETGKKPKSTRGNKKRVLIESDSNEPDTKKAKVSTEAPDEEHEDDGAVFTQPALVTGGKLKDYQLEGVAWMTGLFQNGISGILADEMGLGKTLETIAFHAWLRERSSAPFMVVCPLSVLHNWAEEFKKFAPEIPVCVYHGSPEERARLRREEMVVVQDRHRYWLGPNHGPSTSRTKAKGKATKGKSSKHDRGRKTNELSARSSRAASEHEDEDLPPHQKTTFPVVLTTYDILMKDRPYLAMYRWGFIVVDEGHRLKNMDCKLIREIKMLHADARMVLTGTPLHNNLAELWSLLNFVLPDIFTDLDTFQEWFNLPSVQASASSERTSKVIHMLHTILRPFLLRRLKADVEADLPPKKEYILYAPLSRRQREVYDAIVQGGLRALLLKERRSKTEAPKVIEISDDEGEGGGTKTRSKAKAQKQSGKKKFDVLDGDDEEYFQRLEAGDLEVQGRRRKPKTAEELGEEWYQKAQLKKINNMKLQNTVMQLRKVCSHPFLFDWPIDPDTHQPILNEELVSASGKMMVLDRLLEELFKRGHKVLLFSQFTTMLDIIEDWAVEFKHWNICRIDGSTSMADRTEEVDRFQNSGDSPDAPKVFLLSTRAGGLGLNLTAADTVIFYDQDWNPQMDLQAQDRAHRIGQTKPVLIFRLVTAHTIETKIMQRATEKRKLEALVIAKGKFKAPTQTGNGKPETMAEMAASLLKLEGEKIQVVPDTAEGKASVISDEELDMLLDRRPEVFSDRVKGWTSRTKRETEKTAFAVYDAPVHEGSHMLAGMMGEPIE